MSDFYSDWLERSKNNEKVVNEAPRVMRSKDLKWVRTRQDYKAALMIAPELGFPTGGSCLMRAEIPVGWHTGKHLHGEEAIYVESGEGFMVLDDKRYGFFPGTVLHIPYRSTHQLFNMGKMEQLEDCGANDPKVLSAFSKEESQYWPEDGRRISMHQKQHEKSDESKHGATYFLMGRSGKQN